MPIVAFTQEYSRVSNPQGSSNSIISIEYNKDNVANITRHSRGYVMEDNGHTHGGTTTLKNELRVHLI
jgi:hypothetical protein